MEAVTELNKSGFLATLDRFVSVRGKPAKLHTYHGLNCVAAERELQDLFTLLQEKQDAIVNDLGQHGIQWTFIPPHSPIWKSGIKSTKTHL